MKYAKIENGTITQTGRPRGGDRRTDTGEWVTPHGNEWTAEQLAVCGWVEIVEEPRPEHNPDTHQLTRTAPAIDSGGTVRAGWVVTEHDAETVAMLAAETARQETLAAIDPDLLAKAASPESLTDTETQDLLRHLTLLLGAEA